MTNAVNSFQIVAGKANADESCVLCCKEIKATQAVYGHYLRSLNSDVTGSEPRVWHVMHPDCLREWCLEKILDSSQPLPLRCKGSSSTLPTDPLQCAALLTLPNDLLPRLLIGNCNSKTTGILCCKLISICSGNENEVNRIRRLVYSAPTISSLIEQAITQLELSNIGLDTLAVGLENESITSERAPSSEAPTEIADFEISDEPPSAAAFETCIETLHEWIRTTSQIITNNLNSINITKRLITGRQNRENTLIKQINDLKEIIKTEKSEQTKTEPNIAELEEKYQRLSNENRELNRVLNMKKNRIHKNRESLKSCLSLKEPRLSSPAISQAPPRSAIEEQD